MQKEEMKNAGYNILENNQNSLEAFLKNHYPQVFKDGEFDLNELKNLLNIKTETRGYGLNFVGKSFALQKYSQETAMELKINQKLSKNFNKTQNAVIRGDNLDALKILKNNYAGQVKCIYIDPPYNTKSDEFVYNDNFKNNENELLKRYEENEIERMEGIFKTKQSHSGWLAFMLPRLKLARDLLREDGVIFVSIDDNEQANLKLLMDEVFGEGEFVANVIWQDKYTTTNDKNGISSQTEYLLCYSKDSESFSVNKLPLREEYIKSTYTYDDNDGNGKYMTVQMYKKKNPYSYDVISPTGKVWNLPWNFTKENFEQMDKENKIFWGKDGNSCPRKKVYLKDTTGINPVSLLLGKDVGFSANGGDLVEEILGNRNIFSYPKPVALIKHLLTIATQENDLVLDFFAGSGTTGQAVMELNHENPEKTPRKFILVQWNEEIPKKKEAHKFCVENGLEPVISSITVERLRRAGGKYGGDTGFKVFDCISQNELVENDGQLAIELNKNDNLSKVYNLVVKSGVDLNAEIKTVVEDFIYTAEDGFYVINAKDFDNETHKQNVKEMFETGQNIYIDGWTASVNMTLQQYKSNERMKIVY